jgi:hypothetical protein
MMKNLLLLALFAMFIISCGSNESTENTTDENTTDETTVEENINDTKKYDIESGYIKYKMSMMGMETSVIQYFKEYGKTEKTITEMEMMGKKMKTSSLKKDGYIYGYTAEQKQGTKMKLDKTGVAEGEMAKLDEKSILAQGGKKVAGEEILGKKCDVYEINTDTETSKIWIWKSLVLKMTASQNGMEGAMTMEATEIKETSDFPAGTFDVPKGIEFVEPNMEADFDEEGAKG